MIIPLDKQQMDRIKELHKIRIEAILRIGIDLEEKIKAIIDEINEYNEELGI